MNFDRIRKSFLATELMFVSLIFVVACGGDKSIQGIDLADQQDKGSFGKATLDSTEFEETFRKGIPNTGQSPFLFLGTVDAMSSQILVRFDPLPDSIVVDSATLLLHTDAYYGDDLADFKAVAYQVASDTSWNEQTVSLENFDPRSRVGPVGEATVIAPVGNLLREDLQVAIDVDPALINSWIDTTDSVKNEGFLIDFSSSRYINEFYSRESTTGRPELVLRYMKDDSVRTITVISSADASLVQALEPLPAGPIYAANGINQQTVAVFDVGNIPREATINKAKMVLNVDHDRSLFRKTIGNEEEIVIVEFGILSKPFDGPDSLASGDVQVFASAQIKASAESFTVTFDSALQNWVSRANYGLIVRPAVPGFDLSRIAFFSTRQGAGTGPTITVDFTVPPSGS